MRGIEYKYYHGVNALYIYPTNSRFDWWSNFIGWAFPYRSPIGIVNRTWWREVESILDDVKHFEIKRAVGYSKGGAQACYLQHFIGCQVVSIAGFPPTPWGKIDGVLYKKKGDIVPLFSKRRYKKYIEIGPRVKPWEAHHWHRDEIIKIIRGQQWQMQSQEKL
jgi:hypothetical protein